MNLSLSKISVIPLCIAFSGLTHATHLTSVSVGPGIVYVQPGETASFQGMVDATAASLGNYKSDLSITGEPTGSTTTFSPAGSNEGDPAPYNYTLDIDIPSGTAFGDYTIVVDAYFTHSTFQDWIHRTDSATLYVVEGLCPKGGNWHFQLAQGSNDPFDNNGDGVICTKHIPGQGKGNSANRNGASDVGHIDGHNHKDNNN